MSDVLTASSRVAWIEIDGWGVAGDWITVSAVSDANPGDEEFELDLVSSFDDEVGAQIAIEIDGETHPEWRAVVLRRIATNAYACRLISPDRTPPLATLRVRLDDCFKVSTVVPDFTGTDLEDAPLARWIDRLSDIPRQGGQRIPEAGGVASAPSGSVRIVYDYRDAGLLRDLVSTRVRPVLDADGNAVLVDNLSEPGEASILVRSLPASLPEKASIIGTEAVQVLSASGSLVGTIRGILRTLTSRHVALSPIYDGTQSAIGQVLRVFVLDGEGTYADARQVFIGLVEQTQFLEDMSVLQLDCSGLLSLSHAHSVARKSGDAEVRSEPRSPDATFILVEDEEGDFVPYDNPFAWVVRERNPEPWQWVLLGDEVAAYRIARPPAVEDGGEVFPLDRRLDPEEVGQAWETFYSFCGVGNEEVQELPTLFGLRNNRTGRYSWVCRDGDVAIIGEIEELEDGEEGVEAGYTVEDDEGQIAPALFPPENYFGQQGRVLPPELGTNFYASLVGRRHWRDNYQSDAILGHVFDDQGVRVGDDPLDGAAGADFGVLPLAGIQRSAVGVRTRTLRTSIHIVRMMLQVICSTGTGRNVFPDGQYDPHPEFDDGEALDFDVLPSGFGAGVPVSEVDLSAFRRLWTELGPDARVYSAWVSQEDDDDPAEILAPYLEAYMIGIATGRDGRLRPIDLTLLQTPDVFARSQQRVLTAANVWSEGAGVPARNARVVGAIELAGGARLDFTRWPDTAEDGRWFREKIVSMDEFVGASMPLSRIEPAVQSVELERGWIEPSVWRGRQVRALSVKRSLLASVTLEVRDDEDMSVGDIVFLDQIPVWVGVDGYRILTGVAQVVDTQIDVETGLQTLTVIVSSTTELQPTDRWAPGARVQSTPEANEVVVEPNAFVPEDAAQGESDLGLTSDVQAFEVGDEVVFVSESFAPGETRTITAINEATRTITLDGAHDAEAGDVMLLTTRGEQSASTALSYAFADGGSVWRS